MRNFGFVTFAACGWIFACGGKSITEPGTHQVGTGGGGIGGTSGAGGTTINPSFTCSSNGARVYGIAFDPVRGCAETELPGTDIACLHSSEIEPGYYCARRLSDGQEFIGFSSLNKPVIEGPGWEPCPWDGKAPRPCYGLACDGGSPLSTCTLAGTTKEFRCGDGAFEWDKNCCLRHECTADPDCESGQSCKEVGGLLGQECWSLGPGGTCDCGGALVPKVPQKRCVELEEL